MDYKKYTIDVYKNIKKAECYIECFERMLTVLFENVSEDEICIIEDLMEENYYRWHDGESPLCCEEYILEKITDCYKQKIVAVIYLEDEEEEEDYEEI